MKRLIKQNYRLNLFVLSNSWKMQSVLMYITGLHIVRQFTVVYVRRILMQTIRNVMVAAKELLR